MEEKYHNFRVSDEIMDFLKGVSKKYGISIEEAAIEAFSWYRYSLENQERGYRARFSKDIGTKRNLLLQKITQLDVKMPPLLGKALTLDELLGKVEE